MGIRALMQRTFSFSSFPALAHQLWNLSGQAGQSSPRTADVNKNTRRWINPIAPSRCWMKYELMDMVLNLKNERKGKINTQQNKNRQLKSRLEIRKKSNWKITSFV
jgi:hypothetical protein